jgi:hypothetical protein
MLSAWFPTAISAFVAFVAMCICVIATETVGSKIVPSSIWIYFNLAFGFGSAVVGGYVANYAGGQMTGVFRNVMPNNNIYSVLSLLGFMSVMNIMSAFTAKGTGHSPGYYFVLLVLAVIGIVVGSGIPVPTLVHFAGFQY